MSFRKALKFFTSIKYTKKVLYSTSPFGTKMVRYFPNNFEDYKPGSSLAISKEEISPQIDDHVKIILKRLQPSRKHVEGGLYVGIAGVAYMFYYLTKNTLLSENKAMYLEKCRDYINAMQETSAGDKTSFLLGDAGTYALTAVVKKELGDESFVDALDNYKQLYNNYLNPKFLKCGGDEFFVGRSGYLAGALWMGREMQMPIFTKSEMYKICDLIVASGKEYSKKHGSPCPLMYHYYNTEYVGAAHGISFILQILLTVPGYIQYNSAASKDIKATVDYLVSLQTEEGNWPCCMEELGYREHKLVHWCHGAPGTIYLMAKAYLVYNEQKYLDACIRAGEVVWNKGLLLKGPGICHGIAGNAYVFLLLYRLTGNEKYLYRAKQFADFMNTEAFLADSRVPDNPETLYEGTAGTVCFLADLLVPDKAQFPFQDVFSDYQICVN